MATTHHHYVALQGRLGPQGGPLLVPSSVQDIARGSRGWTGAPRSTTCSTLFVLPSRPSVKVRVREAAAKGVQAAVPPLSMKQCSHHPPGAASCFLLWLVHAGAATCKQEERPAGLQGILLPRPAEGTLACILQGGTEVQHKLSTRQRVRVNKVCMVSSN
jgi:hypothetical protein